MKDSVKEVLRDYCDRIYEAMKGEYPEFLVHYWEDQVGMARLAPEAEGSAEILAQEGEYRMARAALSSFYKESLTAIELAPEEAVLATASAVMNSAAQITYALTEGKEAIRAELLTELNELGQTLSELTT